jgi:hypothetical protein
MSGTIGGTYVQIGADLASVLDNGDELRVLPIVGRGSVQSVADILFLKGVDIGIVRSDTLDYLEQKGIASNIKKQFTYITKLYNEEMHVVARKSIRSVRDLEGKTVSVDLPNGGTFITSIIVFERLGLYRAADRARQAQERRNRCGDRRPRQAVESHHADRRRQPPSRAGRVRKSAAGRLFAGGARLRGLSQTHRKGAAGRYHRGACGARRV